ncbi:ATP-dependent helicase [Pseudonocardiaceae bacterium YIM PH 21723]|nr:ATP-dependent helicase [Pseudonocardiaceae bacterium YIM PH 21723]
MSSAPVLRRRIVDPPPRPRFDEVAQRVLDSPGGPLRLIGGPGTGKTTLLAELVVDRIIHRGLDPENVLVLSASRRAATAFRARITALLSRHSAVTTIREPLVRTVHSYAFGVMRRQAVLRELPPPRLLAGPEQDAVVRELLKGNIEDGARYWPERLRPALGLPGFAQELRDFLLRAAEYGLGPYELTLLGRRHGQDAWVAAGEFFTEYEQNILLRNSMGQDTVQSLDAAELVGRALDAFLEDEELLRTEQDRARLILVDDAQHLAPHQFELIELLGRAAGEWIVAGDPDQSVASFRGADPSCLLDFDPGPGRQLVFTVDHRGAPAIREAARRLVARLPGAGAQRDLTGPAVEREPGSVQVRLFAAEAQEAAWVADQLRRAHLLDDVPWSEMAVLVRSTQHSLPVLRRAMLAAGVPLAVPADELPLAVQSAAWPLLALLEVAGKSEVDPETAAALLTSPLGGADPMALRRLRRGLRRLELAAGSDRPSGELLVEVLESEDRLAALEDAEAGPVRRLGALLRVAREAIGSGAGVEQVLWRIWTASGLEQRWLKQIDRGGPAAVQADRDLDSVVALFDAAARYTDRLPGSTVEGFAEYLGGQQIVGDSLAPAAPKTNAVAVLTAHAAAGREWTVVAVPAVQEGSWPDLRLRGSLLGVERLVDILTGVDNTDVLSATAPLLAEERRLLYLAVSRARRTLLVSAVRGEEDQPSRFLDELDGLSEDVEETPRPLHKPERGLVLAEVVGELRHVVCDPAESVERRERAAMQLARLAEARVPGAEPDAWYGLLGASTDIPLWHDDTPITVSPSTVEVLSKCPMRWVVERHGGQDSAQLASITGSLVHALVQAAAAGATPQELNDMLDAAWSAVDAGAPWFSRREKARIQRMVASFRSWLTRSRGELTEVAVENAVTVDVPRQEGGPWLKLKGRLDRLEVDRDGRAVVVDVKTGKNPVTKDEAQVHPQLAVYQLAAALGAFESLGLSRDPGGARLLFVSKEDRTGGAVERTQDALGPEGVQEWTETVTEAAQSSAGPSFEARDSKDCPRCPARPCCPLQPEGRQVSD